MSKNLRELQAILSQDYINTNAIDHIMVLVRKLLEENALRNNFPFLAFYSDWTVHWALDRNITSIKLLFDLTDVLVRLPFIKKWKESDDGGLIWNADEALAIEVNKSLGLQELRNEFMALFTAQTIPTDGFKDIQKWNNFSTVLVQNLMEQSIKFPDDIDKPLSKIKKNSIEEIYSDIIEISKGNLEKQVVKFSLVPMEQIPESFTKIRIAKTDVWFQMETKSGHYWVGPFWITK